MNASLSFDTSPFRTYRGENVRLVSMAQWQLESQKDCLPRQSNKWIRNQPILGCAIIPNPDEDQETLLDSQIRNCATLMQVFDLLLSYCLLKLKIYHANQETSLFVKCGNAC